MTLPSVLTPIFKANKALTINELNKSLDELEFALNILEEDLKKRQITALNWTRRRS
ncbi:hypothetical protein [Candidatus Methanomassiliicoccus intestinalis]|mgnify:CR=1 FL=1|uniref:hypothetical protein n=1 Tax=Candidatus Methanomassiliicoccus intestinalis TaxID=1406512 RepID=UPI00155A92D8|nr:hypothetical protein [Candidatus Methanomassiliicoccus intestinalis]